MLKEAGPTAGVTSFSIATAAPCCVGKNRALDEDELDFVNAVERSKAAAERAWRDEQDREMDGFREVRGV